MSSAFAAVHFDHDGLLVDTEILFYEITRDMFRRLGAELEADYWSQEYLSKGRGSTLIAQDLGLDPARWEAVVEERNNLYYAQLEHSLPLRPYARETLESLSGHLPLALVTGNTRKAIDIVHRRSGLLDFFDVVVCSEDYPASKPAPDAYLTASRMLGVRPSQCLAVEDSDRGLAAAIAAGMTCIAVPSKLTRFHRFPGAASVQPSLARIPEAVR